MKAFAESKILGAVVKAVKNSWSMGWIQKYGASFILFMIREARKFHPWSIDLDRKRID